jgi:predicted nucleic acid-binding protein
MILAVDTSVLLTVFKGEHLAGKWVELIARSNRGTSQVVACDVVVAEISSLFPSAVACSEALEELGVSFSPISQSSAIRAGRIFREYRRAGGPREFMVPDFLIGAHALEQADALAAIDRGYLRRYFKPLRLARPS